MALVPFFQHSLGLPYGVAWTLTWQVEERAPHALGLVARDPAGAWTLRRRLMLAPSEPELALDGRAEATDRMRERRHAESLAELGRVRRATDAEVAAAKTIITDAPSRNLGAQDLFWGLLNSKEFLFNH